MARRDDFLDDYLRRNGSPRFSKRKHRKIEDESKIDTYELAWMKTYMVFLKASGHSHTYISNLLGVTKKVVVGWLDDEQIQQRVNEVRADMVDSGLVLLKEAQVELVHLLLEVARNETEAAVRLRAIESGLDRAGNVKVNKSESKVTKTDATPGSMEAFWSRMFESLEGLPLDTQQQIAEMAREMDDMITKARGKE